jgi:hypothetical protein
MSRAVWRRYRSRSIAILLLLVAVSALVLVTVAPLFRAGSPHCMKPIPILEGILRNPGQSSCTQCHAAPTQELATLSAVALSPSNPNPHAAAPSRSSAAVTSAGRHSCLQCHDR